MNELSGYVFSSLREGDIALYRGSGNGLTPILLVAAEETSPGSVERLEHEYALKSELDADWAARPVALTRDNGRMTLVLEDSGGTPLDRLLGRPLDLSHFLRIAIPLAGALGHVHARGLIHKDIKPANILVESASSGVWLTGFGIASRLPRERQAPAPPEVIAGTLAYMAPEQTGRMNRSIDSRSDLYALGVTFYQVLTGALPFTAADPMEWVHCHIARKPLPPSERSENIPAPVSEIIMKLLAKTAEERYQTAAGVESDLRRCLAERERKGCIAPFALGEHDTPDRLLLPEKLYGRAREIETLLACFDRIVNDGAAELVLVSGYSGIGKSSVVNELHKVLVPPRGLFASGKFDQYKRDIPYSTLAQAFQSLIRPLLGKSDPELAGWREAFREALGPNGRLIIDLVPELKLIVGDQPPVPELPSHDAQRRFQLVFRRFLAVFARPEHPLALFLDDLQWLDSATLDLLEDLLTQPDVRHLMLIGAYRDNEVNSTHPLIRKLEAIRKAGAVVHEIILAPLAREDLGQLIGDALHCEPEHVTALAELIQEKTAGNPFFAIQFISALVEESLLTFDYGEGRWSWELNSISAKGYTDNVVDLMVGKLNRLPVETKWALQEFACIGNIAQTSALCLVREKSEEEIHSDLWEARRLELIVRSEGSYRFVHDRVQEAAYSLIPEEFRASAHLRIGRLLNLHTPPEKRDEAIFEIVNQLNRGTELIASRDERDQLAELNLIAAKRAKASTAYASAIKFLIAGAALLTEDCWERRHDLMFQLELHRAECEFLTSEFPAADERLSRLRLRAIGSTELAAVACLRIELYTTDRPDRAVEVGVEQLRTFGIEWSTHPSEEEVCAEYDALRQRVGERPIETLADLASTRDPDLLALMEVLRVILSPARHTERRLHDLAILRMASLSLEHGYCDGSPLAFAQSSIAIGPRFGHYDDGFRFGYLGAALVEREDLARFRGKVYNVVGYHVLPWTQPIQAASSMLRRSLVLTQETGDLLFVAFCHSHLISLGLGSGARLDELEVEAERYLQSTRQLRFSLVINIITTVLALIRTLRGLTPKFGHLDDRDFDELRMEHHLSGNPMLVIAACWYWSRKMQARYLAGDYAAAADASSKAQPLVEITPTYFEAAEFWFYAALSYAAAWDSAPPDEKQRHFDALKTHHKQLEIWTQNCPENFESRAALVAVEIARIEGRDLDAMRLYEQAIRSAHSNGFIHHEAIANELAARFYAARGFKTIADAYLRNARHCYFRWGAAGKVRQLDETYPHLREEKQPWGPTSAIGAPVEHLDLATVINVSQAVSSEIVLDKLLDTLMRTAIEQAGAERGLLLLPRGADLVIAAEAKTRGDAVTVQLRDETVTAAVLPESVLHYALNTQKIVIVDDALAQPPFFADPYICHHQTRSILCVPLINQAKLIGVLYLENNLSSRAFAPTRVAVLKLVASQAAISLENARLYRDLKEREAKIRRLVDSNIIGIFIWDFEGQILEANEAFLHMVGYDREELVAGRIRWTDLTPPDWRDRDARWIQEHKAAGSLQPFEKEYFRKDGSRIPVLIGVATFEEGANQGVAFVLDLTERKCAEEALRESETKFRDYAESASDWYWETDPDHKFKRVTDYERLLADGFAPVSRIGLARWEFATDVESEPEKWKLHRSMLETRQPFRDFVYRAARSDGSMVCYKISGKPVFDTNGEFRGYRGTGTDVTALRTAEAEARENEQRYRKAELELAHANRVAAMGELTASITHEVNQPITAAVTYALAARRWLSAEPPNFCEVDDALSLIVKEGNRVGEVVERIRALIKKAPARKDAVAINDAILEVIALTRTEAANNNVSVRTQLAEDLPCVQGDRVQLQQVLLNLIINAIQAMRDVSEEERELLISTRNEPDGVSVEVRDSGPGFAPAALEHVFEAFYTTKPEGMGMGLSICRSIVEAHGGRLWASANLPRGASFQFTLPAMANTASCCCARVPS